MKKNVVLLSLFLMNLPLFAQFKAKSYFTTISTDHALTISFSNAGCRNEFSENGQKGVIIAKIRQVETNRDFSGRVPCLPTGRHLRP